MRLSADALLTDKLTSFRSHIFFANPLTSKPMADEMLTKLHQLEPELRAFFYGNIPGYSYQWAGSRKRRAQSKRVLKFLAAIIDDVEYDHFLLTVKGDY
jgi:hypothetical protein